MPLRSIMSPDLCYHPALSLPTEIRLMIWSHVLQRKASSGNLLLTCQSLYWEVSPIFYKFHPFRFKSAEDLCRFATTPTLNTDRNKLIRKLELCIDCLYITDHLGPLPHRHHSIGIQKGREAEVRKHLRAWSDVFDDWDSFSFSSLRSVHVYFRQWAMYHLRAWSAGPCVDPTELCRLVHRLSISKLVCGGAREITQSGLLTLGAVCAFEELVEKKCAQHFLAKQYSNSSKHHLHNRSQQALNRISHRNALTKLELLHYAAYCCQVKLSKSDTQRLLDLRAQHADVNGGQALNYATQANHFRTLKMRKVAIESVIKASVHQDSLFKVWELGVMDTPPWTWVDEICAPSQKWSGEPDRLVNASTEPLHTYLDNGSTDIDDLAFASHTDFDADFARLVDLRGWAARVEQAATYTMDCLCTECEIAVNAGGIAPHGQNGKST
jgi:hypothetical protein